MQNATPEASYCKFFKKYLSRRKGTENKAKLLLKDTTDKAKLFLFA